MPNYSLVANATFQPFTYQELMAPIERQNIYHEKLNEEYDKLSSQADVLEVLGASDLDKSSGSYDRYKAYSDALRAEADNLYRLGLNSESRQRLSDLRRRYNTDIVPIQNAWNKREEETKMQLSASMQNPSLMFTRDASKTSLDDYIANPMGGFTTINGANITAQMATMASNLAKQIRGGHTENIDDYTVRYITKFGLDENFIRNWRNSPTLSRMFEQVMQSNGVTPEALQGSLNAQSIMDKSTSYAEMGMWNAMGEDKSEIRENFINRLMAQQAKEIAVKRAEAKIAAEATTPTRSTLTATTYSLPMAGADFSNASEREAAMQKLGYTMKNGKLVPTGQVTIDYDMSGEEYHKKLARQRELRGKIDRGTATATERNEYNAAQGMFRSYNRTSPKITVSLYNSDGTIMTRQQFLKQAGNSENARKALNKYFDEMVEAGKVLGVYGNIYTRGDLVNKYNILRENDAAKMLDVIPLNYNSSDWNATSRNYMVQEITGYRGGNPEFSTARISLDDLLNKKVGNNNVNLSAYWSQEKGRDGLILATTEEGRAHRYFIPAESMPDSSIQMARQLFEAAEANKNNEARAAQLREMGLRALHTGLTLHNSGQSQDMNRQLSNKQLGFTGE